LQHLARRAHAVGRWGLRARGHGARDSIGRGNIGEARA